MQISHQVTIILDDDDRQLLTKAVCIAHTVANAAMEPSGVVDPVLGQSGLNTMNEISRFRDVMDKLQEEL